jgi:hypothetical protein
VRTLFLNVKTRKGAVRRCSEHSFVFLTPERRTAAAGSCSLCAATVKQYGHQALDVPQS